MSGLNLGFNASGNSNGTVTPRNTSAPLDADSQIALQQAAAARATYLSGVRQQRQQEEQNYGDSLFDLNKQHPIDVRNLLNNFAGRGLAFSSGYGNSSSQLGDNYATSLSRLAAARTAALTGFGLDRSNYQNEYLASLSSIRQAAADRLSAAAGTLGLGSTSNPTVLASQLQGNG